MFKVQAILASLKHFISKPKPPQKSEWINESVFFDAIRQLFGSKLKQTQVDGLKVFLHGWGESNYTDIRWLAYILATAYHETAYTMQPIQERGGSQYFIRRYWENKRVREALGNRTMSDAVDMSGKGYVQLTGYSNFVKASKLVGEDLVSHPEKAMQPNIAFKIILEGMISGMFTGKGLQRYFNDNIFDPYNARKTVNGLDRAAKIEEYFYDFYNAIKKAQKLIL